MNDLLKQFAAQSVKPLAYDTGDTLTVNVQSIVRNIILALGIVCVVVMLVGGINYMTSSGDTGKLEKAKKTILYGLIGLVICVLAFAIVNFVISQIIPAGNTITCPTGTHLNDDGTACVAD